MTGRKRARWLLWLTLLAGFGWLVATDQRHRQTPALADVPQRQARAPTPLPGVEPPAEVRVRDLVPREQLIVRRHPDAPVMDVFASRSWVAPAVAPSAPRMPPLDAPQPPPFSYLGKRHDDQGWQVYLGRGDLALIVREGDPVEGGYRVESIKPPTLTLVRADGKHQIAIGEWEWE